MNYYFPRQAVAELAGPIFKPRLPSIEATRTIRALRKEVTGLFGPGITTCPCCGFTPGLTVCLHTSDGLCFPALYANKHIWYFHLQRLNISPLFPSVGQHCNQGARMENERRALPGFGQQCSTSWLVGELKQYR